MVEFEGGLEIIWAISFIEHIEKLMLGKAAETEPRLPRRVSSKPGLFPLPC
jgi:hypothetical protein